MPISFDFFLGGGVLEIMGGCAPPCTPQKIRPCLFHKQTFNRCNSLGICQVRHSFRNILDDLQDGVTDYLKKMIKEGKEIR